jgi:eukaryotic translation initiation factor 2C
MLEIPSTTLPYPKPMYNNGPVVMNKPDWNLANRKFFTTDARITFKVFMIGVPCSEKGNSLLRDPKDTIWNDFHKAMQTIYRTATIQDVGRQINSDFGNRAKAQESVEEAKRKGANFVMLLLEKKSTPLYSIFKDLADCQYGMQSLCIVYTKRLSPQYWGNVAMKINLKAGGINHTISGIELIMKDTLVLGACVVAHRPKYSR